MDTDWKKFPFGKNNTSAFILAPLHLFCSVSVCVCPCVQLPYDLLSTTGHQTCFSINLGSYLTFTGREICWWWYFDSGCTSPNFIPMQITVKPSFLATLPCRFICLSKEKCIVAMRVVSSWVSVNFSLQGNDVDIKHDVTSAQHISRLIHTKIEWCVVKVFRWGSGWIAIKTNFMEVKHAKIQHLRATLINVRPHG